MFSSDALAVTPFLCSAVKQNQDEVVYRRPYNIPISYHERANAQLKSLERQSLIRPSRSLYNAPLIPVPQKDGGLRLCFNSRALNKTLREDRYSLLNITTILNQLGRVNVSHVWIQNKDSTKHHLVKTGRRRLHPLHRQDTGNSPHSPLV